MTKKITQEEFEKRVKDRFPEESFTILQYRTLSSNLEIQCDKCKQIYKINAAGNFLAPNKAHGCVNCYGLWRKREAFLKQVEELYEIEGTDVRRTHTYYHLKCKKCGHRRESCLGNLKNHLKCGCETNCYHNRTPQEFIDEVNRHVEHKYELVGEYINQSTKVKVRHDCGFIWETRPADLIHGDVYCPKCGAIRSKGERLIESILKELDISFEIERVLNNSLQRFDFYIELKDKKIAIEYQGKQHYEYIEHFHYDMEGFQKDIESDERKRQYCKDNNIILLEIPYFKSKEEVREELIYFFNNINSTTIS